MKKPKYITVEQQLQIEEIRCFIDSAAFMLEEFEINIEQFEHETEIENFSSELNQIKGKLMKICDGDLFDLEERLLLPDEFTSPENFTLRNETLMSKSFRRGRLLANKKNGYLKVLVDTNLHCLNYEFVEEDVKDADYEWVFEDNIHLNKEEPFMYVRVYKADDYLFGFKLWPIWMY
jgi:hypothetical protein